MTVVTRKLEEYVEKKVIDGIVKDRGIETGSIDFLEVEPVSETSALSAYT